jgi:hypothetical protein
LRLVPRGKFEHNHPVHPFFQDLGRDVLACWKRQNFSLSSFPAIALERLAHRNPSANLDVRELLRDFLLGDEQPLQSQSGFGEPELIVFEHPSFYIQILCWLDGTTDIHQHKFSGAFHVLAGSSLHSQFEFRDAESITARLRVGNVALSGANLLECGATVAITSGRDFIHSLFHLETPSMTVVVRTHTDPGTGPQFTYLPPHLAIDPFHTDTLTLRRKQVMDMLERTDDPEYPELIVAMLEELDFERGFLVLQNGLTHLRNIGFWDDAWQVFSQRHGRLAEFVAPSLEEIIRRDALSALRRVVVDPEHRFFLALLLNIPGTDQMREMLALRHPGVAPAQVIRKFVREISDMDEEAAELLSAVEPRD